MKNKGLILIFIILFLLCPFVLGATINVPTNYTTIQAAIDAATDGDIIEVESGIYTPINLSWDGAGFLKINKQITLLGQGSENTIIDAQHLYSVTTAGPHATCLWLESSNVTLEGLTIKGCDWGIRISNIYVPSTIEISDLNFKDVAVIDNYGHGIIFEKSQSLDLIFKRVKFEDCNVNANGDRGIYLNPGSVSENFILTNTNANDNLKSGFNCQRNLEGLIINGGTFNNNTGGLNYEGNGSYFGAGLELDGVSNAIIENIEANNNGLEGPNYFEPGFPEVVDGGAGIIIKGTSDNIEILNSEINGNANGVLIEYWGRWATPEPTNIFLGYNNIEKNVYFGVLNWGPLQEVKATHNYWGSCNGPTHTSNPTGTGDSVSNNVSFTPWLGICITNKINLCAIESSDVELFADVKINSTGEISSVWFSYTINGINYNETAINIYNDTYKIIIPSSELIKGQNVEWNVYASDNFGKVYSNGEMNFYVHPSTTLTISPEDPDGLNGWYVSEPNIHSFKS
jgi:hypothetical protein